eukprot:TRINITY_DN6405_c0_g1_i1.p1 TRINITY_DN6405_c0_g1~~TRINITY_DN6405_c0_g1_i1.p1  ORF type:complete len:315 (-),score=15.08 TRINITY_DN6405_c0_g1_i1:159-1025(-)
MRLCTIKCITEWNCQHPVNRFTETAPFYLKALFWTCPEECRYQCMRNISDDREAKGLPVLQYFGKWPFIRVFGIQELASTLFSIGNLIPVLYYGWRCYKYVPSSSTWKKYQLFLYFAGSQAWFWSTLFHARDFYLTERGDYYFSDLYVFYLTVYACIRVLQLKSFYSLIPISIIGGWYLKHIYYMEFVRFDYQYNTILGVVNFFIQTILWGYFVMRNWKSKPHTRKLLLGYLFAWMGGMMELFDFPPILKLFDAHSLWHGATILMAPLMFSTIEEDARYEYNEKLHLS